MMKKIRDFALNKESGSGELVVSLITIPILAFLLFTIINVSSYFQVRSAVQDTARDGARLVALYGGSTSGAYLNTSGVSVSQTVKDRLYKGGKCTLSYCATAPIVNCRVVVNGAERGVATAAGQPAICSVSYDYSAVAPMAFGFDSLFAYPIKIDATTVTETGYR